MGLHRNQHIVLWEKFLNESITPTELDNLFQLLENSELNWDLVDAQWEQHLLNYATRHQQPLLDDASKSELFERIIAISETNKRHSKIRKLPIRWAAAAAILILVGLAYWMFQPSSKPEPIVQQEPIPAQSDIEAGGDYAVLTLSDGSQITLNEEQLGRLQEDSGAKVQLDADQISYASTQMASTGRNTLKTPRGKIFKIALSDGTLVYLNASSSITYPLQFQGATREVQITGEVYFEVAANDRKPFIVKAPNQTVEVLGTNFNVNAYPNEPYTKTSLLEGKVAVTARGQRHQMQPNQQLLIPEEPNSKVLLRQMDMGVQENPVAWKDGLFQFSKLDVKEILRQIERWYDIEVVYEREPTPVSFYGAIKRDVKLSNVLRVLEASKLKFRMDGRKLIII